MLRGTESNGKPDPHNKYWVAMNEHTKKMGEADLESSAFTARKLRRIELSGPVVSEIFIQSVQSTSNFGVAQPRSQPTGASTSVAPATPANRSLLNTSPQRSIEFSR